MRFVAKAVCVKLLLRMCSVVGSATVGGLRGLGRKTPSYLLTYCEDWDVKHRVTYLLTYCEDWDVKHRVTYLLTYCEDWDVKHRVTYCEDWGIKHRVTYLLTYCEDWDVKHRVTYLLRGLRRKTPSYLLTARTGT